ncbi:MAG: alpha/beta hydrolase-fold protein [Bacteroidota bacterium]
MNKLVYLSTVWFCLLFQIVIYGQSLDTIVYLQSEILSESRSIQIGLPSNYYETKDSFSTLYTLDAEYRYDICRSSQNYLEISTRIPNTIIIGISNLSRATRNRDLLPKNYGGRDSLFQLFIEKELIPYINNKFRCNSDRIMYGHSHGGVFTISTLFNNPDLFEKYIATDPSFQIINSNIPDTLSDNLLGKKLYLTSSDGFYGFNKEISSDMLTNNMIFQNYLIQNSQSGLIYFAEHISDDHGNSFITAFHRGLRWVFSWPISETTLKKE